MSSFLEAVVVVLVALVVVTLATLRQRERGRCELRWAMRKLWYDHVARTRFFVISATGALPDQGAALDYLNANQDEIGTAVAKFYGADAGNKLAALLREHIAIAGQIVTAAIAKQDFSAQLKNWEVNADEIAAFLAAANRAWTEKALSVMMRQHLAVTATGLALRLEGKYSEEAANFDKVVAQALHMADVLTDGIIAQRRM